MRIFYFFKAILSLRSNKVPGYPTAIFDCVLGGVLYTKYQ